MKNKKVWIKIEATWSGYSSSQSRVVHREYRLVSQSKLDEYYASCRPYRFSDGTSNYYSVSDIEDIRRAKKKEPEIHRYDEIIREIFGFYYYKRS